MSWLNAVLYVYAAAVLGGGVMGYVKAASMMSLAMSGVAALAVVVGVLLAKSNQSLGYGICGAVALSLAAFFAYRVSSTGSLMPGVPVIALSMGVLACLAYAHVSAKPAP
jgi:uncharacterized membrane protein (UPF0136 family)